MAAERQYRLHHTIMHCEAVTGPKSARWMQFVLVGKWGRPGCILSDGCGIYPTKQHVCQSPTGINTNHTNHTNPT
jgi:hypothetical protein